MFDRPSLKTYQTFFRTTTIALTAFTHTNKTRKFNKALLQSILSGKPCARSYSLILLQRITSLHSQSMSKTHCTSNTVDPQFGADVIGVRDVFSFSLQLNCVN